MATGFDKFSKKALAEEGISILNKGSLNKADETAHQEPAPTQKATRAAEKRGYSSAAAEKEETFQMTIVVRMDTKRMLDEMKFHQRRSYKELAEEAFKDLYKKYEK